MTAESPTASATPRRDTRTFVLMLAALFLALGLATVQGARIRHIRDAESFYRWVLAEATRSRVFDDDFDPGAPGDDKKKLDRELFQTVAEVCEDVLPAGSADHVPGESPSADLSRLEVFVRDSADDRLLWNLLSGPRLAAERTEFLDLLRQDKLSGVGSEFNVDQAYSSSGANVSISNVFLGFRKLAANFVWLQVDKYWHQGMTHRMLPLMQTSVALDPHFVDAYLVGAWHLAYNITAKMAPTPEHLKEWDPKHEAWVGDREKFYYRGIDFLKDGIRKNPRNYKLYFDAGFAIYKNKLNDYANAVKYLAEAMRHRHDKWVPRQLYICLELNGQYEEALAGWRDYLRKNPDNLVAPRFILRNQGLICERDAREAQQRAKTTKDPLEKQVARDEADALFEKARAIWEELEEPFATARLLRLDALDCMERGEYLEAIAYLEHARWESPGSIFDEASDLIIQCKQKAGIPLSESEELAVKRQAQEEQARQKRAERKAQQAAESSNGEN